jgi:hypothetical protein
MVKSTREVQNLIKSMGFIILATERGKHHKYRLATPQGEKLLVTSVTASDHRALQNITKQLRSWL